MNFFKSEEIKKGDEKTERAVSNSGETRIKKNDRMNNHLDEKMVDDRANSNSVIKYLFDRLRLDMWLRRPDELAAANTTTVIDDSYTDRFKQKSLDIQKRPFGMKFFLV